MSGGNWNRQGRKSGGYRPAEIAVPQMPEELLDILRMAKEAKREGWLDKFISEFEAKFGEFPFPEMKQ